MPHLKKDIWKAPSVSTLKDLIVPVFPKEINLKH